MHIPRRSKQVIPYCQIIPLLLTQIPHTLLPFHHHQILPKRVVMMKPPPPSFSCKCLKFKTQKERENQTDLIIPWLIIWLQGSSSGSATKNTETDGRSKVVGATGFHSLGDGESVEFLITPWSLTSPVLLLMLTWRVIRADDY